MFLHESPHWFVSHILHSLSYQYEMSSCCVQLFLVICLYASEIIWHARKGKCTWFLYTEYVFILNPEYVNTSKKMKEDEGFETLIVKLWKGPTVTSCAESRLHLLCKKIILWLWLMRCFKWVFFSENFLQWLISFFHISLKRVLRMYQETQESVHAHCK